MRALLTSVRDKQQNLSNQQRLRILIQERAYVISFIRNDHKSTYGALWSTELELHRTH